MNESTKKQILNHLEACNDSFIPNLNIYVDITKYTSKLHSKANLFERFEGNRLVGLIASYDNKLNKIAFISNVSVEAKYQGEGLSSSILQECINYYKSKNYDSIELEVNKDNKRAISFYEKNQFKILNNQGKNILMGIKLERNYNQEFLDTEDHKYAYNFDFDVIHPYMIKSFKSYFVDGNCLELGSFKGDFTARLLPFFNDITCVEASSEALEIAKSKLDDNVKYVHSMFENAVLSTKFDNIVLTHVLEHIDNPVAILKCINDEWLSDTGRFFLVCPNANAPSRQIAVKMGLISHNSAVTPAEAEHGHKTTYTLDTLERDAKAAGLRVVHRSGIFFKALANFQWDQLLQTDIISDEYLEGCYQLGQQYPDLCSSIFLVCKKGE